MSRVLGRTDDMLIIRGVNVFPTQIEAALVALPEISPHYKLIVTRKDRLDRIEVQPEVTEAYYGEVGAASFAGGDATVNLQQRIQKTLREALGLSTKITLLAPGEAPRSEGGKIQRVEDRRGLH